MAHRDTDDGAQGMRQFLMKTNDHSHVTRRRVAGRIVSSASLNSITSILTLALGAAANVGVARTTGPDGYGTFVFVNMVLFLAEILCSFSIPLSLAKAIARLADSEQKDRVRTLVGTTLCLLLTIGIVAGTALSLVMGSLERQFEVEIGSIFRVVLPVILLSSLTGSVAWGAYLGTLRQGRGLIVMVSGPAMMLAYLIVRQLGQDLPLWGAAAISYFVPGLVALPLLIRDRLLGVPDRGTLRPILRESGSAAAFSVLMVASSWADRVVAGGLLGPAAMGLYSSAVAIVQAGLRIPTNLSYVLIPAGTRAASTSVDRTNRFNDLAVRSLFLFTSTLVAIVTVAAPELLPWIFGEGFAKGVGPLLVMAPGLLAAALTIPILSGLVASDQSSAVITLVAISFPLRIAILVALTRSYGLIGTAAAMVIADIVLAAFAAWYSNAAQLQIPFRRLAMQTPIVVMAIAAGLLVTRVTGSTLLGTAASVAMLSRETWHLAQDLRSSLRNPSPQ